MKICDRCKEPNIKEIIVKKKEGNEFDLCIICLDEFHEFMRTLTDKEIEKRNKKK